jgi:hypothetical protein
MEPRACSRVSLPIVGRDQGWGAHAPDYFASMNASAASTSLGDVIMV